MHEARLFAIQSLQEIFEKGKHPKRSSDDIASSLDRRDRSFHMEIVYGVLRYRDTLDWILKHFMKKTSKTGDFTLNNLRMAVYQIFFMRVPDWAVVNESVEIEKRRPLPQSGARKAPLVNAVLRNILRRKGEFVIPVNLANTLDSIAVNTSHPSWIIKRWIERFGEKDTVLLAEANNQIRPFTIRANTLKISREDLLETLAAHGISAEPTPYSPDGVLLKELHTYSDLKFIHGLFAVQDEASQLVPYLLEPKAGEKVLDACAAPGGKTSHIAQLMKGTGLIFAVEKDQKRISDLAENIQVLGIGSVKVITADITSIKPEDTGRFDKILLDAPCSSFGVIRKNPDIKYKHSAADFLKNRTRQLQLLHSVSNLLAEKGRLVYSVCSTEPEEGEQVVREFLKTATDFRIIEDVGPGFLHPFMEKGLFRTYPHKNNMDGFFGAALCRNR